MGEPLGLLAFAATKPAKGAVRARRPVGLGDEQQLAAVVPEAKLENAQRPPSPSPPTEEASTRGRP